MGTDKAARDPITEAAGKAESGKVGTSAARESFSLSSAELAALETSFNLRRELAKHREQELFGVLTGDLNEEERLALEWLYAHMPINDLADYDGELFLSHVRQALETRRRMPWGARVPDELFLHYVLPPRINNERIEDYRGVIAGELEERVRNLTMAEAVLETNYWCYEKATYTGSDARTISPLGLMRSAKGRCGEESTLATAALRSIGIPARQCYTPRWAHVDDNHAWVEAWADGAWHYIGACEPEPALDRGWFDGPARRAMLVHTRVSSGYAGPEPITVGGGAHTEINLLSNYAPTRKLHVRVADRFGRPAGGAKVQFQLYNYAELHPIAEITADGQGSVSFVTGFGDLVVRAAQGGFWGETTVRGFGASTPEENAELVLDQEGQPEGAVDIDLTPPGELAADPEAEGQALSEAALERHREKVAEGERIRAAYERTFAGEAEANALAAKTGLDAKRTLRVLEDARGNVEAIAAFLEDHAPRFGEWPLRLLESLTAKDLIDSDRRTLDDHLLHGLEALADYAPELDLGSPAARAGGEEADGNAAPLPEDLAHVLNPRVRWERLAPYRGALRAAFSAEQRAAFRADPRTLARYVAANRTVRGELTPVPGKASPAGTWALKTGDRESVEILLIALCRSFGIPARLHPADQRPQALVGGEWTDLERPTDIGRQSATEEADESSPREARNEGSGSSSAASDPSTAHPAVSLLGSAGLDAPKSASAEADPADPARQPSAAAAAAVPPSGGGGTLRLLRGAAAEAAPVSVEAAYRENFTLARLENGFYATLEYPFREKDVYDRPFELQAGDYRMTTGIRLQDGRVLGRLLYFKIEPGAETQLEPLFRQPEEAVPVLGAAPGDAPLLRTGVETASLAELAGSRGALVAWIDPRLEPTRHLLREAGESRTELEAAGRPLILILQSDSPVNAVEDRASGNAEEAGAKLPPEVASFVPKPLPSGTVFAYDRFGEALNAMKAACPPPGTEYPHLFVLDESLNVRYAESGYKPGSCGEALQVLRSVTD
ncbi:transglutaminase [Saccharibacillus sp. O23]|uniref:transglutaminase domain-containing protein n=1 Tax=Saccharibacillus sp. O23 TaxID=2009338 RepID=UPI000B4E1CD4|nr:transglutaminase domain-containing protein [Saccharibacillus sp. O23]OWR28341.1 transglutaminase [Saccharibacillus sp. O23]